MLKKLCQCQQVYHRRSSEEGFYSEELLQSSRKTDYQREICWRVFHEEWITLSETSRDEDRMKVTPVCGS